MADPRIFAEPYDPWETPEYFIRADPPSARSLGIWAETARILGVPDA